jgi:hypothetical protein
MKTPIVLIATLAAASLCLTSCGKDSLTQDIRPDESDQITNPAITTRSSVSDPFEFNEIVQLSTDELVGDIDKFGNRGSGVDEGDMVRFVRSTPNIAIFGFGDSRILNWGSWYVEVDLIFNRRINALGGILKFTFPDYGDEVEFAVSGQPALVTDSGDDSQRLEMQLSVIQGSGRFENKRFEGSAVLLDVGSLIDGSGDLRTYLVVEGVMNRN